MINKYEERLGTERMLPLVFKMALPAVAAQFVNLLYSMVDRIYIGHIPGIGTDALAGVGVTTSLVILISSFSAIVGGVGSSSLSSRANIIEMKKVIAYIKESYDELVHKVSWPTYSELTNLSLIHI